MKIQLIRDVNGLALATANLALEDGVPVEPEAEDGAQVEEMEVARRELFDLDYFYRRCSNQATQRPNRPDTE